LHPVKPHIGASRREGAITHTNSVLLIHCISGGMMAIFNTCHRVIVTFVCYRCFKREFPEAEALRMWEACWANYLTDYFHLFLCLAIISIYSDDVIAQDLRTDEMLLHFSSLAMFMDGELILRKVNILCGVFNFNNMYVIPPNIPRQHAFYIFFTIQITPSYSS
jgi:hypothetical protein